MSRALSITSDVPLPHRRLSSGWIVPFVVFLLSLMLSGYAAYSHSDKDLSNRITAVETVQKEQKDTTEKRLDRIESKLDRLIERVH